MFWGPGEKRLVDLAIDDYQNFDTFKSFVSGARGWSDRAMMDTLNSLYHHGMLEAYRYETAGQPYIPLKEGDDVDPLEFLVSCDRCWKGTSGKKV